MSGRVSKQKMRMVQQTIHDLIGRRSWYLGWLWQAKHPNQLTVNVKSFPGSRFKPSRKVPRTVMGVDIVVREFHVSLLCVAHDNGEVIVRSYK